MKTIIPYLMELAETRAMNRAMRLATGVGLVSVEELNERGYDLIQESMRNETSGEKAELILKVEELYKELNFNDAKVLQHNTKFGGVSELQMMSEENLKKLEFALRGMAENLKNPEKKKGLFRK